MRYVSADFLAERYDVDKSTIWRWVTKDILPKPVRISEQCSRFDLEAVEKRDAEREVVTGAPPRVLKATEASLQKRGTNSPSAGDSVHE